MAKYFYRPVQGFDQTILTLEDLLDNSDNSNHLKWQNLTTTKIDT